MQCHLRVVDEPLEELVHEIDVEFADARAREIDVKFESGAAREIDHDARQRFVERHVGVSIAAHTLLVAHRFCECLAERDADVFHGVMCIDVQVASRLDLEIEHAMARDLVEHVIEKRHLRREPRLPPLPSRFSSTRICVSSVLRVTLRLTLSSSRSLL